MSGNRFRSWYASDEARPLILAHRGDSFRAPENTLEAARLGHEAGADGWELDVRSSLDGVPVVVHDESLLRTTAVARQFEGDPRGASGFLVGEFTLDEIRTLDAGSWFVDASGGPRSAAGFGSTDRLAEADRAHYSSGMVRVPTLAESLEWTARLDWPVNVEIKPTTGDREALVEAVLRVIRDTGARDLVTVSSFDHAIVARVALTEPRVATGALVAGPLDRPPGELLRRLGADALHAPCESILAARGFPGGSASGRGRIPVLAYTVNDAGSSGPAARLAEAGVSGLFTDDPASFPCQPGFNRS